MAGSEQGSEVHCPWDVSPKSTRDTFGRAWDARENRRRLLALFWASAQGRQSEQGETGKMVVSDNRLTAPMRIARAATAMVTM